MKNYIVFFQFINENDVWEQEVEAISKEDAENRFYKLRPNLRPHKIFKIVRVWMNPEDNIAYLLQENSTAEVYYLDREYYASNITELTIPDNISVCGFNYKVTSIMRGAIRDFPNIKKINFPKWLNSIGDYAFAYSGIEEIVINSWLININEFAFSNCNNLKLLNIKTTLGLEELSKIKDFIREATIVTSNYKGSHIFDINDWINLYDDSVKPSIGITPQITLFIDGSLTLSNNNFTHYRDNINLEPKVSIVLNKNKCKIDLDFHKNTDIGKSNKSIEDDIIAPLFLIDDPEDYSPHNELTITISSINERQEEIDISGIDDLSEIDIE